MSYHLEDSRSVVVSMLYNGNRVQVSAINH